MAYLFVVSHDLHALNIPLSVIMLSNGITGGRIVRPPMVTA